MKKLILLIIAGAALAVPLKAKAQFIDARYGASTLVNAVSNGPSLSVTNGSIDVRKQKTVGVQITQTTASAGGLQAGAGLYYFYRSMDGTTLDGAPQIVGSPVQTGLSWTFTTNIDSAGAGYLKLVSTNTIATTGIVVTVTYGSKIGASQ